jgi:hypothetical protein
VKLFIPKSAEYASNLRRTRGEAQPCVVCGRPVQRPTHLVECVDGGTDKCVEPGTADPRDPGYMGLFPVGEDCLRKYPELQAFAVTA